MGRRGEGRGTSRDNASANSGVQATGSKKNVNKSKQEKDVEKTVSEEQKRKTKEIERFQMDSPAMSTRAKVAKCKRTADMVGDKSRCDKTAINKLKGNPSSKKKLDGNEKNSISEAFTEFPKIETSVGANSKLSPKPENLTEKAFFVRSSLLTAEMGGFPSLSQVLQATKQKKIEELKRNLKPLARKVLEELYLENEKVKDSNKEMDESKQLVKNYKNSAERRLSLDPKQKVSSKNAKKVIKGKFDVEELVPMLQCSQNIDDQKLNLDLTSSKSREKISLENERKELELNTEGSESSPLLQSSKDIDKKMQHLNLETSNVQQEFLLKGENKVAVTNLDVDESTPLLQDSKFVVINERIQNIDLNAPITKENICSENQKKLEELKTEEKEEIIHLRRDANLRFKFDTFGNKTILVDETYQYTADEKQKLTFNIGDGNMQLSFIENKICILSQRGEINCSIRKNQVNFSLKDSSIESNLSQEVSSTKKLLHSKNTEDAIDLYSKNTTAKMKEPPIVQSEDKNLESGSEDVHMSNQQTNLVPRSAVQQRIQNITNSFLTNVASLCDNYEVEFFEGIKKGNNESSME